MAALAQPAHVVRTRPIPTMTYIGVSTMRRMREQREESDVTHDIPWLCGWLHRMLRAARRAVVFVENRGSLQQPLQRRPQERAVLSRKI